MKFDPFYKRKPNWSYRGMISRATIYYVTLYFLAYQPYVQSLRDCSSMSEVNKL